MKLEGRLQGCCRAGPRLASHARNAATDSAAGRRGDPGAAGPSTPPLPSLHDQAALGAGLLCEGAAELARLRVTRGAHRRTARRLRRALAAMTLAGGMLGLPPAEPATAATPVFDSPLFLADVGFYATPALADIDGDGDLDALVGEDSGNTYFFENTGSATAAAFAPASVNPFGLDRVDFAAAPALADIDGDGDLDALIGELLGDTDFFENTGSATEPAFAPASANPFGLADLGYLAAPALADIDGDGDLDALIGDWYGNTNFFENTGSATAPAFAPASANPFGLADVGSSATPALADIDGDGDLDALIGEALGNTDFFENTGSATAPAFAPASANPFGLHLAYTYAGPALADIDGDGDLDALIGDNYGNTNFFENTGSATAPAFVPASANPLGSADVGSNATPALADIDGDGDLDALIGDGSGNTEFFENTGSANAPAFAPTSANPFGLADVGSSATPALADIDDDGDLDVLIGEALGNTDFFENTGSATAPAFAPASANPFGLADVGFNAAPALADIDGDGDLDALIGDRSGHTDFFENTGSPNAPAFAPASADPLGLADVGSFAAPALADIDGDGDLDALIGEALGNTNFFENTGSATAPAFAPASANPFGLADVGSSATPALADIDDDGDLDALIGNISGNTVFFTNLEKVNLLVEPVGVCGGLSLCFDSLQPAIDLAMTGETVRIAEGDFPEDILVDRPELLSLTVLPGFDVGFTSRGNPTLTIAPVGVPGETAIRSLTISSGKVTLR